MKKVLLVVATLVAVVLVVALVLPVVFRGKITEIVKREANDMLCARLDFGKIDISLLRHFPNASLDLKGLTLVGLEEFEGDTIASVERISVVVDLSSFFGDEGFEVKKLFVTRPVMNARKLADGTVNWDVMKSAEVSAPVLPGDSLQRVASASAPSPAKKTTPGEPSSFRLRLSDLRINDAIVRYQDDSTGVGFSVAPAGLRLRGDMTADRTDIDLRLSAHDMRLFSDNLTLLSGAEAELKAVISADLKSRRFLFLDNTLRLNAIELGLNGWVELRDDVVAMDIKAGCDRVQFKDVLSLVPALYAKNFLSLTASGELAMSLWVRGQSCRASLPAFELKMGVKEGSFQYTSLPKAVTGINLTARISNPGGVLDKTEVDIPKFGMSMGGNTVSASLYATDLIRDPAFRAKVHGVLDLGIIKEVYPLEKGVELDGRISADMKIASRLSDIEELRYEKIDACGAIVVERLDAQLEGLPEVHIRRAAATVTPAAMTLGELDLKVGSSDLTANGQLSGYIGYLMRGTTLSGRLYVKSARLDLNEILTADSAPNSDALAAPEAVAPTASASRKSSVAPASVDSVVVQPLQIPRNINLSLVTELREIVLQKMFIADVSGEVYVADGALVLEHLGMRIFGGTATASGYYSTATDPDRPHLRLGADIAGASFSRTFEELEVVQKLVPLFAETGGNYSLSLDLNTALDARLTPDLNSFNASGEIRSANIRIQHVEAFDALAKALGNDTLRKLDVRDLAVRFAVRDGRVITQPFELKTGIADIRLSGSTGLDQTIDYAGEVLLPASAAGGLLSKVNVSIGGTFSAPKITLGVKEAAEELLKNVIDRQAEKYTGSKTLGDEAQKQAERLREEARKAGGKLVEAAQAQRSKLIGGAKKPLAKVAAEKAGDKLVEEAERQSANLQAEAEMQIEKLTAKTE